MITWGGVCLKQTPLAFEEPREIVRLFLFCQRCAVAVKSLKDILDGVKTGEFVKIADVPVFDEHTQYDMRPHVRDKDGIAVKNPNHGKVVQKYDRARLETIVTNCNERISKSGDLSPFGPGHTIPGASVKETDQPPVYGYAAEYRYGQFGNGKQGILSNFYVRKEHEDALMKKDGGFPRRSIELVPPAATSDGKEFIDWIACLRRSPARDVGILTYAREAPWEDPRNQPVFAESGTPLDGCYSPDGKLRYSMETLTMPEPVFTAEQQTALVDAILPTLIQRFQAATAPEKKPPVEEKKPEGTPPVGPPPVDDKERMKGESDAIRYARLEQEVKELKEREQTAILRFQRAECERQVIQLEGESYELDRASEVEHMMKLDDAGRTAHIERIKRFYRQAPVGDKSWLDVSGPAPGDDIYGGLPKDRFQKVTRYMREHPGTQWNDAITKCPV